MNRIFLPGSHRSSRYSIAPFVDSPPPEPTQHCATGGIEVNPAYLPWHRQDQLLLGWIRSSVTESIQAEVVSCATTRDLWLMLQRNYASTARSRITSLKQQIQSAQKGSLSCSAYLTQIRRVIDEFAFIGASIPEEELITYTINGLRTDFNPVIAAMNAVSHHSPFSFSDFEGSILSHEALIQSQEQPVAFYTSRGQSRFPPSQSQPTTPNHSHTPTPNQSQSAKPNCQICLKIGHTAKIVLQKI